MRKLSPFELDQFDDEKEIQNYYERYERDYNKCKPLYSSRRYGESDIEWACSDNDSQGIGIANSGTDLPRYAAGNI